MTTSDQKAMQFSEQEKVADQAIAEGTAVTGYRAEALDRMAAGEATTNNDHIVLKGLGKDLRAAVNRLLDGADEWENKDLTDAATSLDKLINRHENPTTWNNTANEAEKWGKILQTIAQRDDCYAGGEIAALNGRLSEAHENRRNMAYDVLNRIDPQERRRLIENYDNIDDIRESTQLTGAAIAVAARPENTPAAMWEEFKDNLGYHGKFTEETVHNYMQSRAWESGQRAQRISQEFATHGVDVAIGRPDPAADYTVVTASLLFERTYQAMLNQQTSNEREMGKLVESGDQWGGRMVNRLKREDDLAFTLSETINDSQNNDRQITNSTLDELAALLERTTDPDELKRALQGMAQRENVEGVNHPAFDRMAELDDRQQTDLDSMTAADFERGATRYNNRPPVYDSNTSFMENADRITAYIEPRIRLQAADRRQMLALPQGGYDPDTDTVTATAFAEAITEPYARHEKDTQNLISELLREDVKSSFRMWAIAETSIFDCAMGVANYMQRSETLKDYDPQGNGAARNPLKADWLYEDDTTGKAEAEIMASYRALQEIIQSQRWLSQQEDPRAMDAATELHLQSIENALLYTDSGDEKAAQNTRKLIDTLDLDDWAKPDTPENNRITADREAARNDDISSLIERFRAQAEADPTAP